MPDTGLLLDDGPRDADWTVVLAHGAGAPMDHPFLDAVAKALAARGLRVVRFEFPYMQRRRDEGVKAGPNRMPALLERFHTVLDAIEPSGRLAVAGKSMGGRVATHLAADRGEACVVLGYPFHPPGRPERLRTEHLAELTTPTLIVQGERDPFGRPEEVADYTLSPRIEVTWIPDGDHGLTPRKKSGHTLEGNLEQAVDRIEAFLRGLPA